MRTCIIIFTQSKYIIINIALPESDGTCDIYFKLLESK
jgi:hypothetical protein